MSEIKKLNVTELEPSKKHPTIFEWFDNLKEGEAFILHNDHDPLPLYYQLKAERGDIFDWEYLTKGPEFFEIKLEKKVLEKSQTIGEMAGKDLRVAEAFKELGLEFCCDGDKPLEAACKDANITVEEANRALKAISEQPVSADKDYNNWQLDFLADYIVNIHHNYVNNTKQPLLDLANKINQVHGDAHPELAEIQNHVIAMMQEMTVHQNEEETVLFPFIKALVKGEKEGKLPDMNQFDTVEDPVEMMLHDHKAVADHVHTIEKLTNTYEVPADGCESYKLFYHKLHELDDDLHQHIHLENNILFPKAVQLEKKLTVKA